MPNDGMPRAGLLVSQDATPYQEITRTGNGYSTMTPTAFTSLTVFPTTAAKLELWNNITSGMTMVIDRLSAFQLVGPTVVQSFGIFAMVTAPKAIPTLTGIVIGSLNGRAPRTSTVGDRVVTGVGTSSLIATDWQPWGNPQSWGLGAATPGTALHAEVNGRLLVPPGCSLCLTVVASVATASGMQVGASWYEVPGLVVGDVNKGMVQG